MLFLNKLMTLLIAVILFSSFAEASANNPFSAILNIKNRDQEGEISQYLEVKVRSVSKDEGRFLVKIMVPKTHVDIIEGKDYYRGLLKGLEEKDFFMVLKGVKEGEGDIAVRLFPIIDDLKIDNDNVRIFVAKYKVSSDMRVTIGDAVEKEITAKDQAALKSNSEQKGSTADSANKEDQEADKLSQHFVLDGTERHNNLYRNLMVLIALGILAYLYYRIRKPQ